MIKVLHISPHLGGGVGRVLLSYLFENKFNKDYMHKIVCLDKINNSAKENLLTNDIPYEENLSNNIEYLIQTISSSDIIVIHWWNHPLLYALLVKHKLPPSRVIIWSHVVGISSPNIFTSKLFDYPDFFVFSTPMSYFNNSFLKYIDKNKFRDIWSTGGLSHIENIKKQKSKNFIVGYIGTLDYSKIHHNFIDMCRKINIPNIKFIICGEGNDLPKMQEYVQKLNIADKFIFTGFVHDISEYLALFDVFGYPLNASHYGTCDQVLAEAMGTGTVPIVFDNKMESYMVHNRYDGFVVKKEIEYIEKIEYLYKNNHIKDMMSRNSIKSAQNKFSIEDTLINWNKLYKEILLKPKSEKIWKGKYKGKETSSLEVFFESVIDKDNINIKSLVNIINIKDLGWFSKTKGSPFHYFNFLEYDKGLEDLCLELKKIKEKNNDK